MKAVREEWCRHHHREPGMKAIVETMNRSRGKPAYPFVDVVGPVQVRIIDKPYPSDDGSRLLEVHAHDDKDSIVDPVRQLSQALHIIERGPDVVDRARTDDR